MNYKYYIPHPSPITHYIMTNKEKHTRIGILSDTHGDLAPEVLTRFRDVDLILHAGDVENPETLKALEAIAPVIAVRGNMDRGNWANALDKTELVELKDALLYIVHNIYDLDIDPEAIGAKAVISGHTHQAEIRERGRVTYINPGSATLPRYGAAPSVALVSIVNHRLSARIIYLTADEE